MKISRYKGKRLIHNEKYPIEWSKNVVDRWIELSSKPPLADVIPGITKRLFIDSAVFDVGGEMWRAKYYRTAGAKRRAEALFLRAESVRNFRASIRAGNAGLKVADPLCVWGSWRAGLHEWSVLFMRDIGETTPLPEFLDSLDPDDHETKAAVSTALAAELVKLHDANIYVHDPSKNVLVKKDEKGVDFYFIDFDTVRFFLPLTKKQVTRVLCHCIRPPENPDMFNYDEVEAYARAYLNARGLIKWLPTVQPRL